MGLKGASPVTVRPRRPRVRIRTQRVYELLVQNNLSQNQLAQFVGVSSGYMSMILTGSRSASGATRQRIQEALGVTEFDEIFELENVNDA